MAAILAWVLLQQAAAAPVKLAVDPSRSYIVVVTRKSGLFSFAAGHEHAILATKWAADVCFDPENPPGSSAKITIATASLHVDTKEARRQAGLKGEGPSSKDLGEIQEKMLGPENLAAQKHPEIQFETASLGKKGDAVVLSGPLTIRGRARIASAPVTVQRQDNGAHLFSGEFRVKQTDYGIRPASVGGVVNVKDAVEIRLQIYAKPTNMSCN